MSGDSPLSPGSSGALRRPRLDADGITAAGDAKRVSAALEASSAPNTAKAYRAALNRFAEWLAGRPATDATVAAYVAALMDDGYAPATIKQAAAAAAGAWTSEGRYEGPLFRRVTGQHPRRGELWIEKWWRRWESNPRPRDSARGIYVRSLHSICRRRLG